MLYARSLEIAPEKGSEAPSAPLGTMAVPLDNPSYFSLTGGLSTPVNNKFRLFKKKMGSSSSQESDFFIKNMQVNNRRQIRTLLRSVSSNSADSNQELLVLGEPRASDIAPPSPYLPSHHNHQKISTSEDATDGALYSEEEEVFISEDSVKYYNLGVGRENGRRHSVGTYLTQERERALSVASTSRSCKEEVIVHATVDGELARSSSASGSISKYNRYISKTGSKGSLRRRNMDDILILSSHESQAATLWVNYFSTCFQKYSKDKKNPPPKILNLKLEDVNSDPNKIPLLEERISSVKLQIVIICPRFLELVAEYPASSSTLCDLLIPDRTIAMLLGVTDSSLTDIHYSALNTYQQWDRRVVGQDQDQDFTRDFLKAAITILTKSQRTETKEENFSFSVMPRKVNQSQNRLVVILSEPLTNEDIVKVKVERNGDMFEIKTLKRRNPYTLKFVMPENCLEVSLIVNILVEKNGSLLGTRPVKCESRLRELDQLLRSTDNPLEFMCQTLGFSPTSTEQLDNWMVHNFQKNVPPNFNILANHENILNNPQQRHIHGHEEYTTLLHFAARFGLEKLAWQLVDCPSGDVACEVRNSSDLTPAEIADAAGHSKLASTLSGYMQMNQFTDMYSQLKSLVEEKPTQKFIDDGEYLEPRTTNSMYCVPPPARPISPVNHLENADGGYMDMQPSVSRSHNMITLPKITDSNNINSRPTTPLSKPDMSDSSCINETTSLKIYEDKVQGELVEIINDFKNNVFTLTEVEQLVDNWHKRNDVQKSYKDKQDQLNQMRQEYERLQQILRDEMRSPTPFERFKRFFIRTKPKECEIMMSRPENKLSNEYLSTTQAHRPISSLSLQSTASSSSSGRMSTISAASLGDSGTHSDQEERKSLVRQTSNASEHEYYEINEKRKRQSSNYMIPPAPRPIHKMNFSPQMFTTITERPPHPVPRVDAESTSAVADSYYIQFPPSGLPVNASVEYKSRSISPFPQEDGPQTEYMNFSSEETFSGYMNFCSQSNQGQIEDEDTPEYMNLTAPSM